MKCKNLSEVTKILTQHNYSFINAYRESLSKKVFLRFQASNDKDFEIAKIRTLIGNRFHCYAIPTLEHKRQFVVTLFNL